MRKYLIIVCLFVAPATANAVLTEDEAAMSLGQTYTASFYNGDVSVIWRKMTNEMRNVLGTENGLRQFRRKVESDVGRETAILTENVKSQPGYRTYTRRARFSKIDIPVIVSWSFDVDDRIAGFFVMPQQEPAPSPYLDYVTTGFLRLPFGGEWFVFWGGRTVEQNYHAAVRNQRFAYDFLVVRNGRSYSGDGKKNEQYYCWDQPILSPASGTIVTVVSRLPDNPPGVMDPENPAGNHVIIDLGNSEFALLAHLQRDSVSVMEGEDVRPGQQIGLCGNSGITSEPHLHFHIQDSRKFGEGDGKPVFFNNYRSNGKPVGRGEPVKGETISPDPLAL
ncbi:MAG: M23 family metallopeptidase [Woeseia sp.]